MIYEPEYYVWTDVEENSHIQKKQNKKYIDAVLKNDIDRKLQVEIEHFSNQ